MRVFVTPLLGFSLLAGAAQAETMERVAQRYLVPYVGAFDVLDQNSDAQFGAEFRADDIYYGLRPTVGLNISEHGDLYAYGGFNWDIALWDSNVFFTPNFMIGGYDHSGGKDLGGGLEFRSGLELSYAFPDASRAGIAFNHISNASLYDRNPGAETLLVNYHIPFH